MSDSKPSTIEEAPSLAAITSAGDRVGRVDFTARLGDRMDPRAEPDDAAVPLTSMARPQRPAGELEPGNDDGPSLPFILPPATVDLTMAAEAQRTKAEIAAARGELPDDDDDLDLDLDLDDDDADLDDAEGAGPDDLDDEPADDEPRVGRTQARTRAKARRKAARLAARTGSVAEAEGPSRAEAPAPARTGPVPVVHSPGLTGPRPAASSEQPAPVEVAPAPDEPSGPPENLLIHGVADLAAVAAAVAHLQAEEELRADAETVTRLRAESDAASRAAHESPARARADAPLRSVEEVAASVIAAMRDINRAHERHVESLELETARRCELLTAQAELDAELIRLHARREAHAIISAARMRSGEHDPETVETDQLGEIGETFSRFAETIETTVATGPASPDHLRKP